VPSLLLFGRDNVIAAGQELAQGADFSDPGWVLIQQA
jgi:hypothetical protein